MFFMENESNIEKILLNKFCSNLKPKILDTLYSHIGQNSLVISKINERISKYIDKHQVQMFKMIYETTELPTDLIKIVINYLDYQDYIRIKL